MILKCLTGKLLELHHFWASIVQLFLSNFLKMTSAMILSMKDKWWILSYLWSWSIRPMFGSNKNWIKLWLLSMVIEIFNEEPTLLLSIFLKEVKESCSIIWWVLYLLMFLEFSWDLDVFVQDHMEWDFWILIKTLFPQSNKKLVWAFLKTNLDI